MSKVKRRPNPATAVQRQILQATGLESRLQETLPGLVEAGLLKLEDFNGEKPPGNSVAILMHIKPEIATRWWPRNTDNRPLPKPAIERLAREADLGHFRLNGETIKFDEGGRLIDGQGRLRMVIESGKAVWSWVIFAIERGLFHTVDQGRPRTLDQLLAQQGESNATSLAKAIRTIYARWGRIPKISGGLTAQLGLEILHDHPGIRDVLAFICRTGMRDVYSLGGAAGLLYIMRQTDIDKADAYMEAVGSGVFPKQSPMRAVHIRLVQVKPLTSRQPNYASDTVRQAWIIKGWNAYIKGRSMQLAKWDSERESFPTIE